MVTQSGVTAEVWPDQLPALDAARAYAAEGYVSGGAERNREFSRQRVTMAADVPEQLQHLLHDPQTSGGLLICIAAAEAEALLQRLRDTGHDYAAIIGRIVAESEGKIIVTPSDTPQEERQPCCASAAEETSCCARAAEAGTDPGAPCCARREAGEGREPCCAEMAAAADNPSEAASLFAIFMEEANRPGALDAKAKELLSVALSIATRCEPCLKIHLNKARQVGLTEAEIEEAAWLAIQFGGAPAMMFYRAVTRG